MAGDRGSTLEEIRRERANGELLGPMLNRYSAEDIVAALGHAHLAHSLGVCDCPPVDPETGEPLETDYERFDDDYF